MSDVLVVTQCAPYFEPAPPHEGRMSGVHGSREQAFSAFAQIARTRGWSTTRVEDVTDLREEALDRARVLALFTIGEVPWSPTQQTSVHERLRAGELAVVGVHSATDANHTWPDYRDIIGARFAGHPVSADLPITVADRGHNATRHLNSTWPLHDELYLFADPRPDLHVLLRLDDDAVERLAPGTERPECGYPLAWCHTEGAGRVFYTALGHFPHAWERPEYVQHVAGGLAWACGGE